MEFSTFTVLYHLSSNGEIECIVSILKDAIKEMKTKLIQTTLFKN